MLHVFFKKTHSLPRSALEAIRKRAGLTQRDVVLRMGTKQSGIARLEGRKRIPSMRTVQRYTQAVGARAVVCIEPQAAHA